MSPEKRRLGLVEYLELQTNWITVKELANIFKVSERTIHNDLNIIEERKLKSSQSVQKKRGVGIRIIHNKNSKQNEVPNLVNLNNNRIIMILKKLLIDQEKVTQNKLSELFFVSTTSIKNDLNTINVKLNENTKVTLRSDNDGTVIEGDEISFREALIWFNQYTFEKYSVTNETSIESQINILKQLYSNKLVDVAYNILFEFVQKDNYLLSDYYIFNTLNIYIIQIHRLINNQPISKDFSLDLKSENHTEVYTSSAEKLLDKGASRLKFNFSKYEIKFLSKYLILYRIENSSNNKMSEKIVQNMISYISENLGVDFSNDKKLKKELLQHVPPMIYRLKLRMRTKNPFVSQIKKQFGQTFKTIWLSVNKFETKLNLKFNDDEIAWLTIYFQSALERNKNKQKILVVCQYGIATSELLVNRLKNFLSSEYIIESTSVGELKYYNLNEFELIVSSAELPNIKNVIEVSPFLNSTDAENVKKILNKKENKSNKTDVEVDILSQFLNPKYIFPKSNYANREKLLYEINKKLIDDNFVSEKYLDSVLNREKVGNTDLPVGVAIPHGNYEHVNRTVIVIINNDKKIYWNKYYVDKIIILVLSNKDTKSSKNIIKDLYSLIDDDNVMNNFSGFLNNLKEGLT